MDRFVLGRLGCALALVLLVSEGCACEPKVDGQRVSCNQTADCFDLGSGWECDTDLGFCFDTTEADGGTDDGGAGDGGADGGGSDGGAGECTAATDCDATFGAAPCGAWECNGGACEVACAGCSDFDRDGYGPEAACAGPDCNDADDSIFDAVSRACYSGPAGTAGTGTCRAGLEVCRAGVWTPCAGEVGPTVEACNQEDDDCDGSTDEDLGDFVCGIGACQSTVLACDTGAVGLCVPGRPAADDSVCDGADDDCDGQIDEDCSPCVHVTPTGDDTTADGSQGAPFRNLQPAIDFAASLGGPQQVCVAGGASCGARGVYVTGPGQPLVMREQVSVRGSFETTSWGRCAGWTTLLRPSSAQGVLFDASIQQATALGDFEIVRFAAPTTAGVTVDGASRVTLDHLLIPETSPVREARGVDVLNRADALVTRSLINGGRGSLSSIGVRVVGARATVTANCQSLDASGVCDDGCGGQSNLGIRGQTDWNFAAAEAWGVLLEDAPGSVVETSSFCGGNADDAGQIRIRGDATGVVVRGNHIDAWGGVMNSHGIWADACGGASPWIVDNYRITAFADRPGSFADGVRAIGDCHPVIDSNRLIRGGGELSNPSYIAAVYCGANASGVASRCTVLGNTDIRGVTQGYPTEAAGVRCDDGACVRIANNSIFGVSGESVSGVHLGRTGTLVENNLIEGGCGVNAAMGLYTEDAWARVENNRIFAGSCNIGGVAGGDAWGVRAVTSAGGNELDLHSNYIQGGGSGSCVSHTVGFEASANPATRPSGVVRNNILRAGYCQTTYLLSEGSHPADPAIVENNDFDPYGPPTALYRDAETGDQTSVAAMEQLGDITISGNLSADPAFVSYPGDLHLSPGSACENAGTKAGAPLTDMDGETRDANPDIGPDEL